MYNEVKSNLENLDTYITSELLKGSLIHRLEMTSGYQIEE